MQANKFQGESIEEAIAMVKTVLGPEAMILSTSKIKGKSKNSLFEITAAPSDSGGSGEDPLRELRSELMSIKELIYLTNNSNGMLDKFIMNPDIISLYTKLIRNGISDIYAKTFLKDAVEFKESSVAGKNNMKKIILKKIADIISLDDPFFSKEKSRIIAAFIGTTGVGKTTTIAKLAARLMLEQNKKVGLISIDHYRIGAMDQLKVYGNILGIPCFPAFNRKDLIFALERLNEKDVVLIDTAGHSQYDVSRIEELREVMVGDLSISSHLLLSVTTKESEMNKAAVNFSPLRFRSYIFTKVDEAETCGSIINQIMKTNLPVSYITTGQNVPEDIVRADKKKILNFLLNPRLKTT